MPDAADVYLAKPAPKEISAQLLRPMKSVVGTPNPDGSIHLAFVLFLWENEKFYFETAPMTKRSETSRRTRRRRLPLTPGFMARAEGTARIVTGDTAHSINGRLDYASEADVSMFV